MLEQEGGLARLFWILQSHYLSTIVQPSGMPLEPVGICPASEPCIKLAALVNVPVEATPDTQSFKQEVADITVASMVMSLRLVQPLNMFW